jgi:hypothetical protein
MDDDRIDLSSLDPSRDAARWEARIQAVAALAAARRRPSLERQLLRWARPALALAAGVALAVWATALQTEDPLTGAAALRGESQRTEALMGWAETGKLPGTLDALTLLGGSNGPN